MERDRREFVVDGTPVSVNSRGDRYQRWKNHVSETAYRVLDEDEKLDSLSYPAVSVQIVYFSLDDSTVDLDNIAKAILDGITGPVLSDDSQVVELVLRRVSLSGFTIRDVSSLLSAALSRASANRQEFVLVRARPDRWDGDLS